MQEEERCFWSQGARLAGTLSFPSASGPVPAAILGSGSGHHDRDETVCGKKPFKVISDYLTQTGFAVFRFDDRGAGKSEGDPNSATFQTSLEDLSAAHREIAGDERVRADRICLIGHSEGGLTAAAAAKGVKASVIMLAGPSIPIEELLHRQAWLISSDAGASPEQLLHERRMNEEVFRLVRGAQPPARVAQTIEPFLRSWPGHPSMSDHEIAQAAAAMASIVTAPDYRSLLLQSPADILAQLGRPILALFGSLDRQVEAEPNLRAFHEATRHNSHAAALILPGLNHLFQRARTGSLDEYEELEDGPAPQALQVIHDWLRKSAWA